MNNNVIMIVDDSISFRTVVKIALRNAGYAVIEATDGRDAISKLNGQKINLIVCDVNMPNMDGFSFVRHLKSTAAYKFTPVIVLATETSEQKRAEGRAIGVKAWITKPFQPSMLVDAVAKLIPSCDMKSKFLT